MRKYLWLAMALFLLAVIAAAAPPLLARADSGPPPIPHPTAGREQCLVCHGPTSQEPAPTSHAAFTNTACLGCHPAAATAPPPSVRTDSGTPPIPHPTAGREQCLVCHSPTGPEPAPASHAAFTNAACQGCHASAATTPSPATTPKEEQSCLSCHSQSTMSLKTVSGETLSLFIDEKVFASSIHGAKLTCANCHTAIKGYPHPKVEIQSLRDYNIAQYEICKQCHSDNYAKTLDSVHYEKLTGGNTATPLCTDCHGAHNVTTPSEPRTRISQTCSQCHKSIYDEYTKSVHGKALISNNDHEVPVCTDCHLSHIIADPRTAKFRIQSVDLCINCHSDEEKMQKYGISTNVAKTYLQDFHGASVALIGKQSMDIWPEQAVCTDCHGVHNMRKVDDPESAVIKEKLVETCRNCHAEASLTFPGAWLSHYDPSAEKAPIVFYIRWSYRILIPFIVVGLLIHIIIDLWAAVTHR